MSDGHWEKSATSALAVELDGIRWWLRMLAKEVGIDGEAEHYEIFTETVRLLRMRKEMCEAQSEVIKVFEAARDGTVGETLEELGARAGESLEDAVERLRLRLMPEGMEWPRYEDGEPVRLGDRVSVTVHDDHGDRESEFDVDCMTFYGNGARIGGGNRSVKLLQGERVKRPAPKAFDADGVEIHEGDTVWAVGDALPSMEVLEIKPDDPDNPEHIVWCGETCGGGLGDAKKWRIADQLTHRAPVIAADGKPLLEGQTVWNEIGLSFKVTATNPKNNSFDAIRDFDGSKCTLNPRIFTHERPESWERLEEDARSIARDIVWNLGNWSPSGFENIGDDVQARVLDLVHRAMALAGVSE